MPVHNWTRVDAGTFHAFHTAWITHLSEALNGGLLPPDGRVARRTLTIRHVSGHRIIAMVEIASPGNEDRPAHVGELADKVEAALWHGIHLLLLDLLPPGPHADGGFLCRRTRSGSIPGT